jgi:homoserine O-acetyltransferase
VLNSIPIQGKDNTSYFTNIGSIFSLILNKLKTSLQHIKLKNFKLQSGKILDLNLSYQIFGKALFSAPVILVNHALTGNSNISGSDGWWNGLVGKNKAINTLKFTGKVLRGIRARR